jgi:hypothetical protein
MFFVVILLERLYNTKEFEIELVETLSLFSLGTFLVIISKTCYSNFFVIYPCLVIVFRPYTLRYDINPFLSFVIGFEKLFTYYEKLHIILFGVFFYPLQNCHYHNN